MEVENFGRAASEEMEVADEKPELYDEIYKCYKQKEYRNCLTLLDEVREEHIGYQILKSACMIHLGEKVSEAHKILDDVLLRCPENEFTIYAKGLAYYHEELWEDAAKCFAQARAMNDTSEMERAEVMLEKTQEKMRAIAEEAGESPNTVFHPNYKASARDSTVVRRFGCELCNHFFGKKFNLDRHNRSIHNRKTPGNFPTNPADVIPKPAPPAEVVKKEVSTPVTKGMAGKKKVKCKVCNKLFKKTSLARHEVIHSGLKAFPCGQCDMAFHQKSDLNRHEVSCHGQQI